MDKFVIKTPRPKPIRIKVSVPEKELKQTTILELKGVVVVEDIKRSKALLEIEHQDKQVIQEQLKILEKKIPSKKVLDETKIGITLHKVRKHTDTEIADKATKIYRDWKKCYKDKSEKPKIEVRFDHTTNKYRSAGKRLFEDRLRPHKEAEVIAEAIERTIFNIIGSTNTNYKQHIRNTIFILRYQPDKQEKLLNKQLTVDELCQMRRGKHP